MRTNAESIAHAAARLQEEGAALRRRKPAEVQGALCRILDEWRDPGSEIAGRAELERALVRDVGFSAECAHEGLTRGLADWSGEALREVIDRELGSAIGERAIASGFDLTAVVLAGSIPMPTLLALLLPLALRSPVLVKPSSRDPVTAQHVASSIARVDPQLGRCIELADFPGDDDACARSFLAADCVVAMGSDETLQRIGDRVRPYQRLVSYGHRLSLSILGPQIAGSELLETADRISLDTALWDQQGCLSPAAVYVMGDATLARDTARAIAEAMARAERRWPRGRIDVADAAAIRRERSEAQMRAAAQPGEIEVHASDDTSWTVVLESEPRWRATPLQRFLRVYPVSGRNGDSGLDALRGALRPIARHLAAVALEGFGSQSGEATELLAGLGASRICRAGELQSPPLSWHHDGQPLLLPLARISDLERSPAQRLE